jgi:hypothetical protein
MAVECLITFYDFVCYIMNNYISYYVKILQMSFKELLPCLFIMFYVDVICYMIILVLKAFEIYIYQATKERERCFDLCKT